MIYTIKKFVINFENEWILYEVLGRSGCYDQTQLKSKRVIELLPITLFDE